jgi:hypothetical protein
LVFAWPAQNYGISKSYFGFLDVSVSYTLLKLSY